MKKSVLFIVLSMLIYPVLAQSTFDLGIKGGANFSKISLDLADYNSSTVLKSHIGAFARVGGERVFIQPEVYFSRKGGDVKSRTLSTVTSFDFSTVDVPVLLGVKIIKGSTFNVHALAGPVFSQITKSDVKDHGIFNKDFYSNHYFGFQYGLGVDVLFLTFDARMENAFDEFYSQQGKDGKNATFMLSLGLKIF